MALASAALGQPKWIDDAQRELLYPKSQYLQGYFWKEGVKKDVEDVLYELGAQAKGELLESVTVDVNTQSSSQVSENQDFFESRFKTKTTTRSKLKISGLKVERYYDKKVRKAYAFAYVKKSELFNMQNGRIQRAIDDINSAISSSDVLASSSNFEEAFAQILKTKPLKYDVAEAQNILTLVGYSGKRDLLSDEANAAFSHQSKQIKKLSMSSKVKPVDVAYAMSYDLITLGGINKAGVSIGKVDYENTGMTSPLSRQLEEGLTAAIAKVENADKPISMKVELVGSYSVSDGTIRIDVQLKTDKGIQNGTSAYMSTSAFGKTEDYMPSGAIRLKNLSNVSINSVLNEKSVELKCQEVVNKPFTAKFSVTEKTPVELFNQTTGEHIRGETDASGNAKLVLEKIRSCRTPQTMIWRIDLPRLLDLADDHPYVSVASKENPLQTSRFFVDVKGPIAMMKVEEVENGSRLESPIIGPLIKESLSKMGFSFTREKAKADFIIQVRASARKGGNMSSLYFSFVDAEISMIDIKSGNEVMNEAYNNVKEGGPNHHQAAMRGFKKVGDQMSDLIIKRLE